MAIGPNPFDPTNQPGTYQGTTAANPGLASDAQRTGNQYTPYGPNNIAGGTNPLTGFASRYSPAMGQQAYQNPWYILQDVFNGINPSSPGYQALRDFGADPLTLYNVMHGSVASAGQQGAESGPQDFINFMADLYSNLGTPGGRGFSSQELLNRVFGTDKFGADSKTQLGQILGAGDMSTQISTLFNILRDISNVGMNPLAARGYQASIAQAGDRYGNAMMKAPADQTVNPVEYFRQNLPWLTG